MIAWHPTIHAQPQDPIYDYLWPHCPIPYDENRPPSHIVIEQGPGNFLDRQHRFVTERVLDVATGLDSMMSRKVSRSDYNESYAILNLETIFIEEGEHEFNVNLRGKADLPHTENRLKLIFESQPDEDVSLQDAARSGRVDSRRVATDRSVAGFELSGEAKEGRWRPSLDVGARTNFPIDLFVRARLRKKTEISEKLVLRSRLEVPYFAQEGAKPSLRFNFDWTLDDHYHFLSSTGYRYTRRERLQEYIQRFELRYSKNIERTVFYRLGVFGDNETEHQVQGYFTNLGVKKLIYKDWMFFSIVPEVSFLREDEWDAAFGITFQLQAVYRPNN